MDELLRDFGELTADKRREILRAAMVYLLLYPYMESRGQAGDGVTVERIERRLLTDSGAGLGTIVPISPATIERRLLTDSGAGAIVERIC